MQSWTKYILLHWFSNKVRVPAEKSLVEQIEGDSKNMILKVAELAKTMVICRHYQKSTTVGKNSQKLDGWSDEAYIEVSIS
jgi:hypothetical protein